MIPNGWQLHPQDPNYMFNPQTGQVVPTQHVQAPAAHDPAPAAHGSATMDFAVPTADIYADAQKRAAKPWATDDEHVWIRFPDVKHVGQTESLRVRFLPGLRPEWWAEFGRHRVPGDLVPQKEGREPKRIVWFTCPGPGCAICAVSEELLRGDDDETRGMAKDLRLQISYLTQVLNLTDPSVHWKQQRGADGHPIVDAAGNPSYKLVPALFEIKRTLYQSVLAIASVRAASGDVTHVDVGRNFVLQKTKKGARDMDVEYKAIDEDASPIDHAMRSVLLNRHDLAEYVRRTQPTTDVLEAVADAVRRKARARLAPKAPAFGGYPAMVAPQHLPPAAVAFAPPVMPPVMPPAPSARPALPPAMPPAMPQGFAPPPTPPQAPPVMPPTPAMPPASPPVPAPAAALPAPPPVLPPAPPGMPPMPPAPQGQSPDDFAQQALFADDPNKLPW